MTTPQTMESKDPSSDTTGEAPSMRTLLHALSNKILPIVVFSELALRRCEDPQLKPQLEKIHGASEQARDLLVEIRTRQGKVDS